MQTDAADFINGITDRYTCNCGNSEFSILINYGTILSLQLYCISCSYSYVKKLELREVNVNEVLVPLMR